TEQELQPIASKKEISTPPTKMASEKRNSSNQNHITKKIEDNNSNLVQKINTLSLDSKPFKPENKALLLIRSYHN
ncbi:2375_t:CDS:2, partial [Scutellospora calospora]